MTSPATKVTVECPGCGERFESWHRPSWTRDLDPISEEELAELTTVTCPGCGTSVMLDTLVIAVRAA